MKKINCNNTAYEAGVQRGQQMLAQHVFRPAFYRLGASEKRTAYAKACEIVYAQYDPCLIEEIKGVCDALETSYEELCTFLFGMYAFNDDVHCSCIAWKEGGHAYLGRNSDFLRKIAPYCLQEEVAIKGQYAYMGNSTAFIQLEDGMNEYGLAIGLTYVRPHAIQPGFHAGFLVRYLLGHCQSVEEAILTLHELPIGTSQTLTMVDRTGKIVVVECNCKRVVVMEKEDVGFAVNQFISEEMRDDRLPERLDDLASGMRYQTLCKACEHTNMDMANVQAILQGTKGFLCQYPKDCPADTIWSILYDPNHLHYLFCDGNPSRDAYQSHVWHPYSTKV